MQWLTLFSLEWWEERNGLGDELNVTFACFPIAQQAVWYLKWIIHQNKRLISEIMGWQGKKIKGIAYYEQHCDFMCVCVCRPIELQQLWRNENRFAIYTLYSMGNLYTRLL